MKSLRALVSTFSVFFMLLFASPTIYAAADDGRTGQDFSDLLFSSRHLLEDFDMSKARSMCGAREALNAVHALFKTRATNFAGSDQDPSETRNWSTVAGTPTSITLDWTPYSSKSSAGAIMVRATVENDCTGKSPRDLKWASLRMNIPVNIGRDNKFHISAPKEIHIETICCGNQRLTRIALFTPGGKIIRAEGTMYPPSTPVTTAPPKPTTGGSAQPTSTSGGSTSSTAYTPPVTQPVTVTAPKPKPKPWTMENPCPECEEEKAVVEHYQKRLITLSEEKTKEEGKLKSTNKKIADLEKKIKGLEARLEGQKGTGAGAFDPATGIRTTAYDQGDGTVLVKRIYPDGTEEEVERYTRRSSADIKRDLAGKKRELERLKNTKTRLEKRIANLDAHIKKTQGLLKDAIAAFKACLDYCNRKLGITSTAATGTNMAPGGDVTEERSAAEVKETTGSTEASGSTETSSAMDVQKNVEQAAENSGSTVGDAVKAAADAVGAVSMQNGDSEVSVGYKYDPGAEWRLKYNWSSGYTHFNEDGNIDYDFKIEPPEGRMDGDGIETPDAGYFFIPASPKVDLGLGMKYTLKDSYNSAGLPFTYDSDALEETPRNDFPTLRGFRSPYSSFVNNAFELVDEGAPAGEIGSYIGAYYRGKPSFVPPWYMAAMETIDILDEYDEYEEDIYPDEYGTAVAQAVLAAGGSPRDAAVMAMRAVAWAGGSWADISRVRLSTIYNGYPLKLGTGLYNSWNTLESIRRYIPATNLIPTKFTRKLLQESPPSEYHGFQHQFRFGFNRKIRFIDPALSESGSEQFDWERIAPRIGLSYDVVGNTGYTPFRSQGRYMPQNYSGSDPASDSVDHWTINSESIAKVLGIDVNRAGNNIAPGPGRFLVFIFHEGNLVRIVQDTAVIPNDPLYQEEDSSVVGDLAKKSFGLVMGVLGVGVSTTDHAADYQWGLHAIGLTPQGSDSGWDIYDGSEPNVVVAVIDSGSDLNHPDGPAYLWTNSDEIPDNNKDDDNNGYIDDVHGWNFIGENNNIQDDFGHGAFVAGIIAAKTNNGIGIAGVNPGARIMTLKATDNNGKSRSLAIYRAIRYAVDNGARVINISLGQQGLSKLEQIAINYAWNMGCMVVVAAGNQAGIVSEYGPPGSPRAFSVASVNVDGKRRGTSNRGRTVTIGAPGEAIYSLSSSTGKHDGQIMPMSNTEYHRLNGTSFAAPYVSGAASLLWGKYPDLSNRQLASLLTSTADDINEHGWDVRTGAGMLNVRKALVAAQTPAPGLRISDIRVGREKSKILWVDLYGVVDGPIESYTIAVAEGSDPDDDEYVEVYGPAATLVDHGLLCRIPGDQIEGKKWTFRLSGKFSEGRNKTVKMSFDRDGKILD